MVWTETGMFSEHKNEYCQRFTPCVRQHVVRSTNIDGPGREGLQEWGRDRIVHCIGNNPGQYNKTHSVLTRLYRHIVCWLIQSSSPMPTHLNRWPHAPCTYPWLHVYLTHGYIEPCAFNPVHQLIERSGIGERMTEAEGFWQPLETTSYKRG